MANFHTALPTEDPSEHLGPHNGTPRVVVDGPRDPRALRCCSAWQCTRNISAPHPTNGAAHDHGYRPCFLASVHGMLTVAALLWIFIGVAAYTSGHIVEGPDGGGLTVVQSLYLMSQIATTVGYGDLVPKNNVGMLFSILYILFSSLIISAVITQAVDFIVDKHQAQAGSVVGDFFDDGDPHTSSCLERNRPLIVAAVCFFLSILTWALFYSNFCDPAYPEEVHTSYYSEGMQKCEGRSMLEAVYMATVTLTTLGFGDITPRTTSGQVFFTVGATVGIATYLNLVGAITESLLEIKKHTRVESIDMSELDAADISGDGKVDLYEFTRFILQRYQLIPPEVLEDIKKNFEELDLDKSGYLTSDDVASLVHRRKTTVHRTQAWSANHRNGPDRP